MLSLKIEPPLFGRDTRRHIDTMEKHIVYVKLYVSIVSMWFKKHFTRA